VVTFKRLRFNHDGAMPLLVFPFFWTAAALRVKGASPKLVRQEVAWVRIFSGGVNP
jgi:hypothetical protein